MKKIAFVLCAVCLALVLFASCSPDEGGKTSDGEISEQTASASAEGIGADSVSDAEQSALSDADGDSSDDGGWIPGFYK